MIVRLMHEGQYEVPDSLRDELNAADDRALTALADGDVEALNASIEEMWELVRANGDPLPGERADPRLRRDRRRRPTSRSRRRRSCSPARA